MRRIALLLAAVFLPLIAMAHHSRAEYSQDAVEIEGKLIGVLWRNPHPGFTVETIGDDGRPKVWEVEGWSSLYTFDRAGITRDRFAAGDTVRVVGLPSGRRPGRMLATHILLADGTEAVLKRDADPYWGNSAHLGGRARWEAETRTAVVDAATENRGLFRVWSYPAPAYQTREHVPLTAAAQASRAEFDEVENYIMACGQKSMPGSMLTPNPYELIDNGATITLRGYEGDVVRTVHMNDGARPPAVRERQGFSVGRRENERTLVIRTSEIAAPHLGFSGVPLGDGAVVEERYVLSDDQTRLDFKITVTDPETFTEPATFEYYWLALGETFGRYDCDVH
jgi:Family of unknown function (DUF6152)